MKQPIDSRQLRAFKMLSQTGSFTIAAKKLYLSQSAVSHSMKTLEEDLGCRLFDRLGKKIVLTPAGEQLLHYADKILEKMEEARTSLLQLGKWGSGRLRLGASISACEYFLPTILREFKKLYPSWMITIETGDTPELLLHLTQNNIDLAIGLEPFQQDAEFAPLFSDELAFLVAPSHAWAKQKNVSREEIPNQNYILYKKQSYTFHMLERHFQNQGIVLRSVMEIASMEAIKELVKLELGVGILAPWIALKEIRDGELVATSIGRRKLTRTWGLIQIKGHRRSLAEETFCELCRTHLKNYGQENSKGRHSGVAAEGFSVAPLELA